MSTKTNLLFGLCVVTGSTTAGMYAVEILQHRRPPQICLAAQAGDADKVRQLLEDGASVNARDNASRTPLHHAAVYRHAGVVDVLFQHGANVHLRGRDGGTALHSAAVGGDKRIVARLLAAEASVKAQASNGYTALHLIMARHTLMTIVKGVFIDRMPIVVALLNAGADMNARAGLHLDITPLSEAVSYERKVAAKYLLARGADANLVEQKKLQPFTGPLGLGPTLFACWQIACNKNIAS